MDLPFIVEDTIQSLAKARRLRDADKRYVGEQIHNRIKQAKARLELENSQSRRASLATSLLEEATAMRHDAIAKGASSELDPDWLVSSTVETWLAGEAGNLDSAVHEHLNNQIHAWVRSEAGITETARNKPEPSPFSAEFDTGSVAKGRQRFVLACMATTVCPFLAFFLGITPFIFIATAFGIALVSRYAEPPISFPMGYFIGLMWQFVPYWALVWIGRLFS